MPKIKAFRGLRPAKDKVLDVIAKPFDRFYTEESKSILRSNPYSFLHAIEPLIDNPFLRASREELIFKKAKEYFDDFLEHGILVQDAKPAVYIYRTVNNGKTQTGIWTCTSIDDYLNNTLKKHEFTRADREKDLIEYLENTGIDANPVLVAYRKDANIEKFIQEHTQHQPDYEFHVDTQDHFLWKIDQEEKLKFVIEAFEKLPAAYIADGHHRAAASSLAGIQRRKNNLRHSGNEEYNYFSTLYFSADELLIYEFQRLVKDLNGYSETDFLNLLRKDFELTLSDASKPKQMHEFKMYLSNTWYRLKPLHINHSENPVKRLDVSILQDKILYPVLGIDDPRTDERIQFEGGLISIGSLCEKVDKGEMRIAFFLYPTSIEELFEVADSGNVMPPKSTWFEPKLHCGLVVHKVY